MERETLASPKVAWGAALDSYLQVGGLPEVVLADPLLRPRILKEYVDCDP